MYSEALLKGSELYFSLVHSFDLSLQLPARKQPLNLVTIIFPELYKSVTLFRSLRNLLLLERKFVCASQNHRFCFNVHQTSILVLKIIISHCIYITFSLVGELWQMVLLREFFLISFPKNAQSPTWCVFNHSKLVDVDEAYFSSLSLYFWSGLVTETSQTSKLHLFCKKYVW